MRQKESGTWSCCESMGSMSEACHQASHTFAVWPDEMAKRYFVEKQILVAHYQLIIIILRIRASDKASSPTHLISLPCARAPSARPKSTKSSRARRRSEENTGRTTYCIRVSACIGAASTMPLPSRRTGTSDAGRRTGRTAATTRAPSSLPTEARRRSRS